MYSSVGGVTVDALRYLCDMVDTLVVLRNCKCNHPFMFCAMFIEGHRERP